MYIVLVLHQQQTELSKYYYPYIHDSEEDEVHIKKNSNKTFLLGSEEGPPLFM